MTSEELTCDVVEKILQDLEETIETLQKIKKKFRCFHSKTFSL
jgi:endoglucanase Acf2